MRCALFKLQPFHAIGVLSSSHTRYKLGNGHLTKPQRATWQYLDAMEREGIAAAQTDQPSVEHEGVAVAAQAEKPSHRFLTFNVDKLQLLAIPDELC